MPSIGTLALGATLAAANQIDLQSVQSANAAKPAGNPGVTAKPGPSWDAPETPMRHLLQAGSFGGSVSTLHLEDGTDRQYINWYNRPPLTCLPEGLRTMPVGVQHEAGYAVVNCSVGGRPEAPTDLCFQTYGSDAYYFARYAERGGEPRANSRNWETWTRSTATLMHSRRSSSCRTCTPWATRAATCSASATGS